QLKIAVTRDYGRSAKEKSDELLFHMALATLSVALLIALALGPREAAVVLVAIPVTLSLTLLVYFLLGYTLNRITLFALIFSIGILVDDAIVVVENIHRHFAMADERPLSALAVEAVAEVGNPTILATWAVIAAILPMAFVGGLMGPYMRPIPVGASCAMLFSLAVAFVVSPWAFTRVLAVWKPNRDGCRGKEGRLDRLYRRGMRALLERPGLRRAYFAATALLLIGAGALVLAGKVVVKMLPFDNKDEFEVVLNLPEDASFAATRKASAEIAGYLKTIPEVRRVVSYVGASAPYNFNGLVRHYFLRRNPNQADIAVQLLPRSRRRRQSHEIARAARAPLSAIARRYGARLQVAEVPPGPPVLSTLVLELYGPRRRELARKVLALLQSAPGIVDVDTYEAGPQPLERLLVDRQKSALNAIAPARIAQAARQAVSGELVDLAHTEADKEPVEIRLRLPQARRHDLSALLRTSLISRSGSPLSIGALTSARRAFQDEPIDHKNLRSVSYVLADVSGPQESPIYAMLNLQPKIRALGVAQYFARQPSDSRQPALKWDGEWQITYEVFRDLGLAFLLALLLIYALVVAWFESFSIPLVIMAPIPLTLIGILPAHWLLGAFFTATSMIGFIAGAGIVVRNSIILVDFIELRRRQGVGLREAVVDAGAVRFRPMLLTAAAVAVGAGVILFDPIFQGLAISLIAGEAASTLLSRTAVPILYFLLKRRQEAS
ncbi:MAG: efflux RND transporter permease subunit, partial [Elusimicrobia bacterium]|nr:efflux RND transporter permease subunit [Elusimicrobiota bacterium]